MMQYFEEEMNMISEVRAVEVVYMDFSKSSDKVPHDRLGQKVQ